MDRLSQLTYDLSVTLAELREEACSRDLPQFAAPLSWLDEASAWLNYELVRLQTPALREPVAFSFVPTHMRK